MAGLDFLRYHVLRENWVKYLLAPVNILTLRILIQGRWTHNRPNSASAQRSVN